MTYTHTFHDKKAKYPGDLEVEEKVCSLHAERKRCNCFVNKITEVEKQRPNHDMRL